MELQMNSTSFEYSQFGVVLYAMWWQTLVLLRRFLQRLDHLLQVVGPQEGKAKAEEQRTERGKGPAQVVHSQSGEECSRRDEWRSRDEWRNQKNNEWRSQAWGKKGERRLVLDHLPPLKDPPQVTALVAEAASPLELIDLVGRTIELPCFNAINAAAVFSKLAKFSCIEESIRTSLVPEMLAFRFRAMLKREPVQVRSASNTFWAVVKLQFQIPILQEILTADLLQVMEAKAQDMNERDIVNVMYSCAQFHRREEYRWRPMIRAVMDRILCMAPFFSCGRVVSGLLWSTANLMPKAPELTELLSVLVSCALARRDFDTLGICHLACSASKIAAYDPKILDIMPMVAELILANRRLFAPDQIVMILISAARLSSVAEQLREVLPELAKTAGRSVRNLQQKDIASVIWASTKLNCPEVSQLAAQLEKQLGERGRKWADLQRHDMPRCDMPFADPLEADLEALQ